MLLTSTLNDALILLNFEPHSQAKHLVVIPAYNEEESLPGTLSALSSLPSEYDILVVDDGSRDRTAEVASSSSQTSDRSIRLVRLPFNGGIGAAVQTGYLFALEQGDYECVIQCDADGQHDPADPAVG